MNLEINIILSGETRVLIGGMQPVCKTSILIVKNNANSAGLAVITIKNLLITKAYLRPTAWPEPDGFAHCERE
jgi:hypothetical protein